jgi:hypothetical protein
MPWVSFEENEIYPAYEVGAVDLASSRLASYVDEATVIRWEQAAEMWGRAQDEMGEAAQKAQDRFNESPFWKRQLARIADRNLDRYRFGLPRRR